MYSYFAILFASSLFQAPKEEADDANEAHDHASQRNYRDSPVDESGRRLNWNLTNKERLSVFFKRLFVFYGPIANRQSSTNQ